MEEQVKFAVVGCGRISTSHIAAIEKAPSAHLVAVCDIEEEKARKTAEKCKLTTYYTDMDDMLVHAKPDVVCICTPSGLHGQCAAIAAKRGVHVFTEKPLDITAANMDAMIAVCHENNVHLGAVFQRRMTDAVQIAKKAVADGKIGKLVMADAYLKYYRDQAYYDSDAWRGTWALDGGGCLMNQCIHGIDLLRYIAGEVESVSARCATLARDIEVEDTAVSTVQFKNGALGVIEAATSITPGQDTVISLHGTKGSIAVCDNGFSLWQPCDNSPMPEVHDNMGGLNCAWVGDSLHAILIEDMAHAVLENRDPIITGEDARRAVDIILAIYESSRTGKVVAL